MLGPQVTVPAHIQADLAHLPTGRPATVAGTACCRSPRRRRPARKVLGRLAARSREGKPYGLAHLKEASTWSAPARNGHSRLTASCTARRTVGGSRGWRTSGRLRHLDRVMHDIGACKGVQVGLPARGSGAARLPWWPIGSSAAQPAGVGPAPCASGKSPRAARFAGQAIASTGAEARRTGAAVAATGS